MLCIYIHIRYIVSICVSLVSIIDYVYINTAIRYFLLVFLFLSLFPFVPQWIFVSPICGGTQKNVLGHTYLISSSQYWGVAFANTSFHFCFVADNLLHFYFKRASWNQASKCTKDHINYVVKRVQLNLVVNKLPDDNVGEFYSNSLQQDNKKLDSSIKYLDSKSQRSICVNYEARLDNAINQINRCTLNGTIADQGGEVYFVTAAYQAYSCIVRRQVEGRADIIFLAGSYFSVIADGRNTGCSRSVSIFIRGYKSSNLVYTMTTCLMDAAKKVWVNINSKACFSRQIGQGASVQEKIASIRRHRIGQEVVRSKMK